MRNLALFILVIIAVFKPKMAAGIAMMVVSSHYLYLIWKGKREKLHSKL